jgi:pyridoxamine 5'-phosphate oxidase
MAADLAGLRDEYRRDRLDEGGVDPDALVQVERWLEEAVAAQVPEPTAMVLATVDADGPCTRTVLCKGIDGHGLRFFTNRHSRKGRQLAADPACAITFLWKELERQVGIRGSVEAVPDDEADVYFASRPRGSQLGAWASAQSEVVPGGRPELEAALAEVAERWPEGTVIPRPPHWGGYVVVPASVEVWQGRPDRLHDRLRYTRLGPLDQPPPFTWRIDRLAP